MNGSPRSEPPELANFRHVGYLGGGGFADVFLYEQLRPARQVALKVLREAAVDEVAQRSFDAEADLMATVSTHPYIVSVYGAEIAPDSRPFLVMEYYPRPHFGLRCRQGPMPVAEVLQVGVRLASAVETAHRAGILHRDIKPANILVSKYGRPGLTDFGIAGTALDGGAGSQGFSAAYAPREIVLDESPGDARSDVYSLAATLYTLLAGRSPFEITGGDNNVHALMQRVISSPLPRIERDDLPPSLSLLLTQSLAKDPGQRPPTAADLSRSLQRIEAEMGHTPTEFEVADDTSSSSAVPYRPSSAAEDEDGTRASKVQVVRQESAPDQTTDRAAAISSVPAPSPIPASLPSSRGTTSSPAAGAEGPPTDTVARIRRGQEPPAPVPADPEDEPAPQPVRSVPWVLVASVGVILVVLVGVALLAGGGGDGDDIASTTTVLVDDSALVIPDTPPVPTDVTVVVAGGVATVTWDSGDGAEEDDSYVVTRTDSDGGERTVVDRPTADIEVEEGSIPCFEVSAQRGSRLSVDASERGCAS